MILEIRPVKAAAICRGSLKCETYKNHPNYLKGYPPKTIPKGERALFFYPAGICFCEVHAIEFLENLKKEIQKCEDDL